jgi:peptide/nickel transport system substrate-binding protein
MKMPILFNKISAATLALLLAISFLQSCKGDPKTAGASTSTTEALTNTLRIRTEADANNLNLLLTNSGYSRYICQQMFQTMGIVDPKTLNIEPLMITNIPKERKVTNGPYKGCLAYDFELLEEAKWDNGSPITANDFIFTVKIAQHPLLPTDVWRSYFEDLRGIEPDAANPKKFSVFISKYYILGLETFCQFPIYPAYHYDAGNKLGGIPLATFLDAKKIKTLAETDANLKAFADDIKLPKYTNEGASIVGSGPYRLETMKAGEGVMLIRKQNWWGDAAATKNQYLRAYPEKIVYRPIKDESVVENMIKNGELDMALTLSPSKFLELKANANVANKYDFSTMPMTLYNQWVFNIRNPKLADKRTRQALAYLVDYDNIITSIQKGLAKRTVGPINPIKSYYNNDIVPYTVNIEKAQELLKAAGWADSDKNGLVDKNIAGKKTDLTLTLMATNVTETGRFTAENIKETCRKAGVNIEIQWTDINKITTESKAGNFETVMNAASTFPGADDLYQMLHSKSMPPSGDNRGGFTNAKADKLIESIRKEADIAKRKEMYRQLQVVINDEVPVVYLSSPVQRYIVSKRFEGVISSNRPGYYEQFFKLKGQN